MNFFALFLPIERKNRDFLDFLNSLANFKIIPQLRLKITKKLDWFNQEASFIHLFTFSSWDKIFQCIPMKHFFKTGRIDNLTFF